MYLLDGLHNPCVFHSFLWGNLKYEINKGIYKTIDKLQNRITEIVNHIGSKISLSTYRVNQLTPKQCILL